MSALQNNEQPVPRNLFWKPAVVGLGDGMIISLALVTLLYAVEKDATAIMKITSFAAIFGTLLVGIAGYFSAKFRMESLRLKTPEEEDRSKKEETVKTIDLFKKLDLGTDMQEQAAHEIEKDSVEWKQLIEKNDQSFEIPDKKHLPFTGFIIGLFYLLGAVFPLIAFFFFEDREDAFIYTLIFSFTGVYLAGYTKSLINGEPLLWGSIRQFLLAVAAVICAWLVAMVFIMMTP